MKRMKRPPVKLEGGLHMGWWRRKAFLFWRHPREGAKLLGYMGCPQRSTLYLCQNVLWRRYRVERLKLEDIDGGVPVVPIDPGSWADVAPHLYERLTECRYPDREVRVPGRLTIEIWDGQWRAQLTEPDAQAVLSVMGQTPDCLLPALEALLGSPGTPWRVATWLPAPKKRGKK